MKYIPHRRRRVMRMLHSADIAKCQRRNSHGSENAAAGGAKSGARRVSECCSHVAKPSKLAAANRRTRANKEPKLELNSSIVNVRPPFVSDEGIGQRWYPKLGQGWSRWRNSPLSILSSFMYSTTPDRHNASTDLHTVRLTRIKRESRLPNTYDVDGGRHVDRQCSKQLEDVSY